MQHIPRHIDAEIIDAAPNFRAAPPGTCGTRIDSIDQPVAFGSRHGAEFLAGTLKAELLGTAFLFGEERSIA